MPSQLDGTMAERWVKLGVMFHPVTDLFERRMKRLFDADKPPPNGLQYFDQAVREAHAADWPDFREAA